MEPIVLVHLLACAAGLITAAVSGFFRRFGAGSRLLAFYLVPAALSAGALALAEPAGPLSAETALKTAFALLAVSAPGGLLASYTIECRASTEAVKQRWVSVGVASLLAVAAAVWISRAPVVRPDILDASQDLIVIGPLGYLVALYLLIVSVMALANLEQTLRSIDETLRWEVKFLALGLGAPLAASVYVSATVLLYPPRYAHIPLGSLRLYAFVFLVSSGLIVISWRRSSGRGRVVVSHGLVYSSITLLAVGVYLIASSLFARWTSQWAAPGFPIEPFVLLLSILVLAVVLLATEFRHKTRRWIRRHLLGGHYDYREFWLEAAEKIRSTDTLPQAASSLAEIIQKALGAIDISVWLRRRDPNRLELTASLGTIGNSLERSVLGIAEALVDITEPLPVSETGRVAEHDEIDGDFLRRTRASLLVPLASGGRLIGILTLGPDRSGRPYGWEAREFLQVLANHAASEMHKTELLASIVQAKEAEAFKTFSTFLLHDLKNFASTLSLIARNAARHRTNPEFQRDSFRSVQEIADKMKRLCNSLRTFSGSLAADKSSQDLNQLITSVTQTLDRGLVNRVRLELGEIPRLLIDAEEVSRIVYNLVLNAHEAIGQGKGWIRIRTSKQDGFAEITVEDNGQGMTRDFLENRLFLPFHTTRTDGLGIGLYQCKKIVDAHGGRIQVESAIGKGTLVRVLLPLAS